MGEGLGIEIGEDEREYLTLLGFLYLSFGKWEKAGVIFEVLHAIFPSDGYFSRCLGFAYLKMERYEEALDQARKSLELAPSQGGGEEAGWLLKAHALWGIGDAEGARACLRRVSAKGKTGADT